MIFIHELHELSRIKEKRFHAEAQSRRDSFKIKEYRKQNAEKQKAGKKDIKIKN